MALKKQGGTRDATEQSTVKDTLLVTQRIVTIEHHNKSIPYIYLHDTITMAVIITARNSLHTILNFQFFSELLPQSPQNLPKKSQTS